jgi:tripartite-type tricarboxylate transporter receptor subunit TctC
MNALRPIVRWSRATTAALMLTPALFTGAAHAQPSPQTSFPTWPQKTVRFVIPLPPGSGTDLTGRLVAERLTERWGQPVVVENRQGADGIPAVSAFLSARDNHTFLLSFAGVITFNALLHERLPYDPATDLVPIAPVIDNFLGVSATALLKVNSLAELVRAARAQPGKLNWAATPGLPYYVLLALQKSAGIDMMQVSYRDFAPAYQDLNQGRLHVAATGVPTLAPHHQAGTAKLLFVTNRDRSPQTPDVPTAAEAGYGELTFEGTVGLYGWRDMPASLKERIATDLNAITADPAFRARAIAVGTAPRGGTPAAFAAAIEQQRAKIAAIHQASAKSPAQ